MRLLKKLKRRSISKITVQFAYLVKLKRQRKLQWPVLADGQSLASAAGVSAYPTFALVGPDGKPRSTPLKVGDTFEINDIQARIVGICKVRRAFTGGPFVYTTYDRAKGYTLEDMCLGFIGYEGRRDYAVIGTTLQIVGESLAEAADVRAGERVLDVAAGNGNASLAAARRGCDVTSTDYVDTLLQRGAEHLRLGAAQAGAGSSEAALRVGLRQRSLQLNGVCRGACC